MTSPSRPTPRRRVLPPLAGRSDELVDGFAARRLGEFRSLRRALVDYADWRSGLGAGESEREREHGQVGWSKTRLAKRQRAIVATTLATLPASFRKGLKNLTTCVDLGCGDGQATMSFLQAVGISSFKHVVLVDQSAKAVNDAREAVIAGVGASASVKTCHCDVRDPGIWENIAAEKTVVVSSAVLHELTAGAKRLILRRIAKSSSAFVLVELLSEHDEPKTRSAALLAESAAFYDCLIADTYRSVSEPSLRRSIVGGFLLAEMLDIWTRQYRRRGNYHMQRGRWEAFLRDAGLKLVAARIFPVSRQGLNVLVAVCSTEFFSHGSEATSKGARPARSRSRSTRLWP